MLLVQDAEEAIERIRGESRALDLFRSRPIPEQTGSFLREPHQEFEVPVELDDLVVASALVGMENARELSFRFP